MPDLQPPTGTVTMLFTDIEGSTRLARALGDEWPEVLDRHHAILRRAIEEAGGHLDGTEGDAVFAIFPSADAGVAAATAAQRALHVYPWPSGELLVRMGLHTATVDRFHDHYVGLEIHRAARVAAASHGGQVILTGATHAALMATPPCDDLGAHRLKDFPDATPLLHLIVDGQSARDFPPPKTLDVLPTNLPPTDVVAVGRDREIDAVRSALLQGGVRVLTLTGPGGSGKTTTALEIARSALDGFPGGVWLVRAETLTATDQLPAAIGEALWLRPPGADPIMALVGRLADRRALLVLDNLEHLDGVGALVAELVHRAPTVTVLTTSRAPLRLAGERVVALGPLPIDAARHLLCGRANLVGAALDPEPDSEGDRAALDELCQRLDCLPLALELMAPRLRLFSANEALSRLEAVADISSTSPDRPDRQRSVRATVEWSVGLLPEAAATLVCRLAAFDGPAPLHIIEDVCGWDVDAVEALAVLLDFSLVRREATGFSLVTAVREVMAERLAASEDEAIVRRNHADALAALAERVRRFTASEDDRRIANQLRADAWAATDWARSHDRRLHRRLVIELSGDWALSGHLQRALDEIGHALADDAMSPVERGELCRAHGYVRAVAMQSEEAIAAAEEATRLLQDGPREAQARAYIVLSQALNTAGRLHESRDAAAAGLARLRELGDEALVVRGLVEMAGAELALENLDGARVALDEAAQLADQRHNQLRVMLAFAEADLALASGDLHRAIIANAQLLEDDFDYPAWSIAGLAVALSRLGESTAALELGAITIMMATELGTDVGAFTQFGDDIRAAMARSRSDLSTAQAAAAERAGRSVPAGQRLARAREVARHYLEAPFDVEK